MSKFLCEHCGARYYNGYTVEVNMERTNWKCPACNGWTKVLKNSEYQEYEQDLDDGSKYRKNIKGVPVDIYDVLYAFNVTNPAIQHALKKLLAGGNRGHKDRLTDLQEAEWSISRAIELENP